jgi:hypothetical protein
LHYPAQQIELLIHMVHVKVGNSNGAMIIKMS